MVYLSIESRKGGVGKTTTALTLAETLLGQGYQVLMFDLDIVGTTLDNTFIKSHEAIIHEVHVKGEPVNLVSSFKKQYMAGGIIPSFALKEENKNKFFSYEREKCNYIGSNIYGLKELVLLEDPRILYDAFHAYWLLEFVKGISQSFASAVGSKEKVAVILDNSPGFSSLENCIHDFITDLGPEHGKVLLVSTIDPQDIEACRQSKSILEALFYEKVRAGEYYRSMVEHGDGVFVDKPAFKSVWNSLCASGGRFPVYHSCNHESVSSFVSLLVNKVPEILKDQLYSKDLIHRTSEVVVPFLNHLLYYFSDSQLAENKIKHQQNNSDKFVRFSQSGSIKSIETDNNRYLEFCHFSQQTRQGNFLLKEWAPLFHFNELIDIMRRQGALKNEVSKQLPELLDNENICGKPVTIVEQFVRENLAEESQLYTILPFTVDFVTQVLSRLDEESAVDFHPDHPRLQENGEFVISFGLATYRLIIYGQVCDVFNMLIRLFLEDPESVEKLNKESICNWINNVLEGRVIEPFFNETLSKMLGDRMNARELIRALNTIIKSWGL